jgi:hypothetical protein
MLKKLNCAALALPIIAAGTLLAPASPALALGNGSDHAILKYMNFDAVGAYGPIHVISTDGKKWNAIKPGTLNLSGTMSIKAKGRGRIIDVGVALGQCGPNTCSAGAVMYTKYLGQENEWSGGANMSISTDKIPVSNGGGIPTIPYGDQIIAKCNEHLSASGPTQEYTFNRAFTATFLAVSRKKRKRGHDTSSDFVPPETLVSMAQHAVSDGFTVKIICDPVELETAEDVPDDPDFGAKGVKVFLSTFVGQTTKPNPGTTCKKARVLARINTTKTGPVKFNLWTKVGNGPSQKQFVQAWSSQSGSEYKAEYIKWISVSKTTKVQAMVEDLTNPIGQSTGWKDITLHCTGAGGGGLADAPKPNDDGPLVSPLKVTGELTLADKAGAPKDKPRLGQAVFKIWATKPGSTSYKLTCSGGRKWEGTLPTFKVADKKYQAVGAANFQIAKTEQIGCALRSTSLPKNDVIALATKLFKLVKRNPNVSGPGGVTIPPKPQTGKPNKRPAVIVTPKPPKRPAIKVAPVRKIACIGGKVSRNSCFCPARTKKVKIGANAYRCIVNVVKPIAPPKRVIMTAPARLTAPVKRVAPAGNQRRFGKTR